MLKQRTSAIIRLALAIGGIFLSRFAFAAQEIDFSKPKSITLPLVQKGPEIDGRLDDAVWQQASSATNFLDLARLKKTVSEQTDVLMLRDENNLYFGFICDSHAPDKIKTTRGKEEHDPRRLYKDDVVEIFIDTEHSKNDFYHWIINSNGAIYDLVQHRLLETERMISSPQWDSKAVAAGSKDGKHWFVEVKIPLSDFEERDLKALKRDKKWGLQFGRENWSLPEGKKEFSTWSRTYKFEEPEDFGEVSFSGKAIKEKRASWVQTKDDTLFTIDKPKRYKYNFTKIFDFGAGGQSENYPQGVIHVDPQSAFTNKMGYGFVLPDGLNAYTFPKGARNYYGSQLSPLVIDYIASKDKSIFKFNLPRGKYRAIFVCGSDMINKTAPVDMNIDVNGSKLRIQNLIPARIYMPGKVNFSTDGDNPVKVIISPQDGTEWVLNYFLVFPIKDKPEANRAFYWLERDNFNYPFEKYIDKAKIWITFPPEKNKYITKKERKAGFSLIGLPSAKFTPRNHTPQKEDSRGPLRAMTSPGFRTTMQFGFFALKSFKDLQVRIDQQSNKKDIKLQLLQMNYQINRIGRGSLGQFGFSPRLLFKPESIWIDENTMQSYYIIADIDKTTPPGVYTGKIGIYNGKIKLMDKKFIIIVLPFSPQNKRQIRSMYYNPPLYQYSESKWGKYSDAENLLVEKDTRNQLMDLKRHGIDKIHTYTFYKSYSKDKDGKWHYYPNGREKRFLKLLKEEGVSEHACFLAGYDAYSPGAFILNDALKKSGYPPILKVPERYKCQGELSPEFFKNVSSIVKEIIESRKKYGLPIPAFDVWDEPGYMNSKALVPFLDAIHKAGGRTSVTLMPGCFPYLSGKVDVKTYNGMAMGVEGSEIASPEEVAKFRAKEKSIYTVYYNGAIGAPYPCLARMGFGYWAWAWNLNGLDPYKYWKISGDLMLGRSWHPVIFDADGNITATTPAWEMFSEATYDNNLVQELEDLVAATGNNSKIVNNAKNFLRELKQKSCVNFSHIFRGCSIMTGAPIVDKYSWPACRYDYLRAKLVSYIMEIKGLDKEYPKIEKEINIIESDSAKREGIIFAKKNKDMPPSRKGNLFINGGFEEGAIKKQKNNQHRTLWGFSRVSPQAEIQEKFVHSGKHALRIEHKTFINNDVIYGERIRLVTGKNYKVTFWAKRDAAAGDVAHASGVWLMTFSGVPGSKFIRRDSMWFSEVIPTFDWKKFTYSFIAEKNEKLLQFTIYYTDKKSTVYFDDISIIEKD